MYKLGIIGCGNMGGAMLKQILKAGVFSAVEVLVADKNAKLRDEVRQKFGVQVTEDNKKAADSACLLLAVKPQFIADVGQDIADAISPECVILSIVAGYEMRMLHSLLKNEKAHIIRIMPNTPAMVGEGVMAACRGKFVTDEEWDFSLKLLSNMGIAESVTESQMDAVTGLSGSSPAFAFLFMEALADAGVRAGLPRAMAQKFAAQVLVGSGKLALETGMHPGQLKDMVTSPAGTTIEGVAALEECGFRAAVLSAMDACRERCEEMKM